MNHSQILKNLRIPGLPVGTSRHRRAQRGRVARMRGLAMIHIRKSLLSGYRVNIIGVLRIARERGPSPLLLFVHDGVRYSATEFSHGHEHPIEVASASDAYAVVKAAVLRHATERIETEWAPLWRHNDLVRAAGTYCLTLCDVPRARRSLEGKVWVPPAAVPPDATLTPFARAYLLFLGEVRGGVSDAVRREVAGIPLLLL